MVGDVDSKLTVEEMLLLLVEQAPRCRCLLPSGDQRSCGGLLVRDKFLKLATFEEAIHFSCNSQAFEPIGL